MVKHRRCGFWGNDAYTKLLLHFDGADESQVTHDSSHASHGNATAVLTAQLDTAQAALGVSSLLVGGANQYVYYDDSDDWTLLGGDFTIEAYIRVNEFPASGNSDMIVGQYEDADEYWMLTINNTSGTYYLVLAGVNVDAFASYKATLSVSADTWYHIAVARSGASCLMFLNGTSLSVTETVAWGSCPNLEAQLRIGSLGSGYSFDGWIDELRISKGIARWTTNFTPQTIAYR